MTYRRQFAAKLHRLGQVVSVLKRVESSDNELGNTTFTFTNDRDVIAFRTYPNRNTEIEGNKGDRERDAPVFCFPTGPDQPEPPAFEDRLQYNGQTYEMGARTVYDTHVERTAVVVRHE
jgi:hypothetical protein